MKVTYYLDWITEHIQLKCDSTNINDFVCVLDKAIENLKKSNQNLEATIKDLGAKNAALESKIDKLSLENKEIRSLLNDALNLMYLTINKFAK